VLLLKNKLYLSSSLLDRTGLVSTAFSRKGNDPLKDVAGSLQIKEHDIVSAEQVHAGIAVPVTGRDKNERIPEADALITKERGLALAIRTADCLPIFILDTKIPAIAAIHAGYKGTMAGITSNTIKLMADKFGTDPSGCLAVIGPSIGPCCYPTDLWQLNVQQLKDAGLDAKNIELDKICTSCNPKEYFSYRRDREETGRMYNIIILK
jgi:copper oxidase (laccase) domain-containing protein